MLDPAGIGLDVAKVEDFTLQRKRQIWVNVTLDDTDERLPKLLALLTRHGESWLEHRRDRFTDEELSSAPLLIMKFQREHRIFGGPRAGTTYDLSDACKVCGAGARQTSAVLIDGEELHVLEGRAAASTPYSDIIVDEPLARQLSSSGATGISFRGVFASFEQRASLQLPWRQMCAATTLPPMWPRSTGIRRLETKCSLCIRSGLVSMSEQPTRLAYRAKDLVGIQDVVTWEWFGEFRFDGDVSDALFPYPWFLVTPKVRRIFLDAGATGFDWIPIRVVDE